MTAEQTAALAAIAAQQPKERSAIWMVGEQLKDMVRAEPGIAALLLADLAGKGMGPCSLEEPEEWVAVVRCAACRHRTEPKCNKADDTARGIAKCDDTKSPCYGRLVYLTEFCSHGEREEDA